jgi:hypothetical protein
MKNSPVISELHRKIGTPSSETVQSLRLLTAFVKLTAPQRHEVIGLAERLASDQVPHPEQPLS